MPTDREPATAATCDGYDWRTGRPVPCPLPLGHAGMCGDGREPLRVIVPPGRSYGIIDTNREEPPMTTTERTHDTAAVEGDIALVEQALDHIKRVTADNAMRAHNAAQAGASLAYAVENFLRGSDPCDDCTEALREAWRMFMARHSGNFTDSAMAVNGT